MSYRNILFISWIIMLFVYPVRNYSQNNSLTLTTETREANIQIQVPAEYKVKKPDKLYHSEKGSPLGTYFHCVLESGKGMTICIEPDPPTRYDWDEQKRAFRAKMAEFYHPNAGITTGDYTYNNVWNEKQNDA